MPVKKKSDRHTKRFTVHLPEEYRAIVTEEAKKNRRTVTEEIKIAIEKHLKTGELSRS